MASSGGIVVGNQLNPRLLQPHTRSYGGLEAASRPYQNDVIVMKFLD